MKKRAVHKLVASRSIDGPGSVGRLGKCSAIFLFANTLLQGAYGMQFLDNSTNVMISNNNFSNANYGGICAWGDETPQSVQPNTEPSVISPALQGAGQRARPPA